MTAAHRVKVRMISGITAQTGRLLLLGTALLAILPACSNRAGVPTLVSPNSLDFGADLNELTVKVSAPRSREGEVSFAIEGNRPWISVSPEKGSVEAGASEVVTVRVTRALMKPAGNLAALTVTFGGEESAVVLVRANMILSADFEADPVKALTGEPIVFNERCRVLTGADPITQWEWEFGDGTASSERNPVHAYSAGGKYSVRLTVHSASLGDRRTREGYIIIEAPAPPRAEFLAATLKPMAGDALAFADVSVPGTSPITRWLWDFGDGGWSELQNPVHLYTAAAVYDVYLTVKSLEGADTRIQLGYVDVQPAPPRAEFAMDRRAAARGEPVDFTDLSLAGSRPIESWTWDFGDGSTAFTPNPRHRYGSGGTFAVVLTVSSAAGTDSQRQTLTVGAPVAGQPVPPTAKG